MEAEKYQVLDIIGRGSFGIIRKVKRKSDGYVLCRKEISYARMSQKEREQLQSELSILKGLRHSNIVAYYEREHIKASSDLHIYMEYCEDGDLARKIRNMKTNNQMADEDFVWSVFAQIVSGLYRCHNGQDPPEIGKNAIGLGSDVKPLKPRSATMILHRDLKPDNIFLGADSSVKLGDFGLSKIVASHDFASTYVGTPFYMSPEICAAEQYGWHSDIWALGCVMYELCAKEPPFNAKTHLELIQKIRLGKVKPLSTIYSKELQDVISQCLRVNPNSRPDTAQLLNVPMVKLKRKEIEMVDLGRRMQVKLDLAAKEIEAANQEKEKACQKWKEAERILARSGSEEHKVRQELECAVRREWEVKARLEIDRQVQQSVDRLQKEFELKVERRVAEDMERRLRTAASSTATSMTSVDSDVSTEQMRPCENLTRSSTPNLEDLPEQVPIDELIIDSPTAKVKPLKRAPRSAFTRAQTMFDGSPMDVQMAGTTPAPPIGNLGLSPRRTGTTKPSSLSRKIFAKPSNSSSSSTNNNHADVASANPVEPGEDGNNNDEEDEDEDDDEDDILLPSPTRKPPIRSGDPFKAPANLRPGMKRQTTAPARRAAELGSAPSLFKRPVSPQQENIEPSQTQPYSFSPLSRKQSQASLLPVSPTKMLRGRTLVELTQGTAVWDPERDDMPSPFLHRTNAAAGGTIRGGVTGIPGTLGGPGKGHLR